MSTPTTAQSAESPAQAPAAAPNPDDYAGLWAHSEVQAEAFEKAREESAAPKGQKAPTKPAAEPAKAAEDGETEATADAAESPEAEAQEADDGDENAEPDEASRDRDTARLKKLAQRLGFKIEGDAVAVDERAQFRAERRKSKEAIRAEHEALEKARAEFEGEKTKTGAQYKRLADAVEAGDLDAVADVLGHKSFSELSHHFMRMKSSPEAKRIEALEKEKRERDARDQKEAAARAEREHAAKVERERKEYFAELSSDVDDAEDESVKSLGKVQGFKELVLRHEQQEYDPVKGVTIPREEAIKRAVEEARSSYAALHAVFGSAAPAAPEKPAKGAKPKAPSARSGGAETLTLDQIDTTTPEGNARFLKEVEALMKANA